MSTFGVVPPVGFELEQDDSFAHQDWPQAQPAQGEHASVKAPAGFELEQSRPETRVTPPPGFHLENRVQPPFGFEPENLGPFAGAALAGDGTNFGATAQPASAPLGKSATPKVATHNSQSFDSGQGGSDPETLKQFQDFWREFLDSNQSPGATASSGNSTRVAVHSGDHSWANDSQDKSAPIESKLSPNLVRVAYPTGNTAAAGQAASAAIRPAASEPSVDPRYPYGKKTVQTPQGPVTVALPRPPWRFISYELDPKAYFDTTIGAPTSQVRSVRDRYEQAAGGYVNWTPEERRILDRLLALETARAGFAENINKYAVEPLDRAAAKAANAFADIAEQSLYIEPFSTAPDMPSLGILTGQPPPPAMKGVIRGVAGTVGAIVGDPRNWPLFFAGGLSGAARKAIAQGFVAQMVKGAYDAADRVQQIWDDPNITLDQKYEAITNSVLSALIASSATAHAMHGGGPPQLDPRLVEQLNRMGPTEKQEVFARLQARMQPVAFPKPHETVVLKNGSEATVLYVSPEMGVARVQLPDGQAETVRLGEIQPHTQEQSKIRPAAEYPPAAQKTRPSPQQVARWRGARARRPAVGDGESLAYQLDTCGPTEILAEGGGEQVWVDNISPEGFLQDAKYITRADLSPYVLDSKMDPEIRGMINEKTENQFKRYRTIIQDANTPMIGLEIITNDPRAVAYFQRLLKRLSIPGRVVVK